ncbi:GNAT family N-acetyltransferase [Dankookia rubra]|uniref:GNAT family N-acetyltransferase n=1 Tax=Dankookia rubra TaxID=1442381 RepID=A0A4R5Q6G9_9PROT|nr:GNAT family N-acetyltransferase [Dankookia rubra]TDH58462.1 GNAT family N-acetyltransferase [Dankookia rubra]
MRLKAVLRRDTAELRVEFVTEFESFEALRDPWEALAARHDEHSPGFFQSFAWARHVARVRGSGLESNYRFYIAKVMRNERLLGLWPLSLQRKASAWLLCNLDDPYGQFAGAMFEDDTYTTQGIIAILKKVYSERLADGIRIDGVIVGSPLHTALLAAGLQIYANHESVVVDLRAFSSFNDYVKTINPKTRKNLRNMLNRLERSGPTRSVVVTEPEQIREIIKESFTGRLNWLNDRGKSSLAFRSSDFLAIIVALPDTPSIKLQAFKLTHQGSVVAQQWGFVFGDRYYAYISSRDSGFEPFSVGRIHLGHVIHSCYDDAVRVLELMPPKADYKMTWTDKTRRLDSFALSVTVRGRLILDFWLTRIDPFLRRMSHHLPQGVRRRFAAFVNIANCI